MTEIVIGSTEQPPDTRVVTIHCLVAIPEGEPTDDVTYEVELFSEVEDAIRRTGFSFANLGVYDGARWLAPEEEQVENLQDVDVTEELTEDERIRKEQIDLQNEMIEAQKRFHRLTAAFVMDRENYNRVRRIISGEDPPEGGWEPVNGDMHAGYPIVVRPDGGKPHLELVDRPLRPSQFAGTTSVGVPLPMEFQAKDEEAAEKSVREGFAAQEEAKDNEPSAES